MLGRAQAALSPARNLSREWEGQWGCALGTGGPGPSVWPAVRDAWPCLVPSWALPQAPSSFLKAPHTSPQET